MAFVLNGEERTLPLTMNFRQQRPNVAATRAPGNLVGLPAVAVEVLQMPTENAAAQRADRLQRPHTRTHPVAGIAAHTNPPTATQAGAQQGSRLPVTRRPRRVVQSQIELVGHAHLVETVELF